MVYRIYLVKVVLLKKNTPVNFREPWIEMIIAIKKPGARHPVVKQELFEIENTDIYSQFTFPLQDHHYEWIQASFAGIARHCFHWQMIRC